MPAQLQDKHQRDSRILQEFCLGGMIRLQPRPLGTSDDRISVPLVFFRAKRFGNDEHRSDLPPSLISRTIAHPDYRTGLDNFLQVNGGSDRLRWEAARTGPQHRLTWTAICYSEYLLLQRLCPRLIQNTQLTTLSAQRHPIPACHKRRKQPPVRRSEYSHSNVSVSLPV